MAKDDHSHEYHAHMKNTCDIEDFVFCVCVIGLLFKFPNYIQKASYFTKIDRPTEDSGQNIREMV